jgi:iron(III) transport system permease protein
VLLPALVAGIGTAVPIVYLVLRAFDSDLATVQQLVLRQRNLHLLVNTVALTGGVLVLTSLMAVPLAWLAVRSDLRFRRALTWFAVIPLAIPGYVVAYALIGLGGHNGLMAQVFDVTIARPRGYWGAAIALSLYTFPYLFLNLRSALLGLDPSLEESARSLGLGGREVLRRVVLPQLRPALLAGWLVIALYVLGDFGVVALMRYEAFSYAIYLQYSAAFDRVYAAWLSLMLLALTLGIVATEARLLGNRRYARVGSGAQRVVVVTRLGRAAPLAYAFVAVVLLASLGLPATVLGYWLWQAPPDLSAWRAVGSAFTRSASVAAPTALLAAAVAMPVAYMSARVRARAGRAIERLAYLGYAIPPVSLALAMVFFALRSAPWLYQTLPLLVAAYLVSFLALAIGPIRSALLQVPVRLEEAARSLGRQRFTAFFHVVFPIIRRPVVAATALVLLVTMKELPITFLLGPTGFTTLSVSVFSRTSEAMMAEAAPYAFAIVLFSSLFVGLLISYEGRR